MSVSLQQPMRPAEIALVELANQNEAAIAQEIVDRTAADTTLQENITAEATAREAADNTLQANITAEATAREQADTTLTNSLNDEITARQALDTTVTNLGTQLNQTNTNLETETTNRTNADSGLQASIEEINAKFPVATANIADNAVTSDKILDGTINTIDLNEGIQNQLSFLASVPTIEFGTSNSFDVSGNNYADVTVTFTTKTEAPIVLCGLQHATGNLTCVVTGVTNQQFAARVYNLSSTDVTSVTLDWLTISGR